MLKVLSCSAATKPRCSVNRSLLKKCSGLSDINGPAEVKEAKKVVATYTALNSGTAAATAQAPGFDEVALAANEVLMATIIFNGVYDFKLSKTVVKALLTGLIGNRIGTSVFKGITKFVTWVPGVGNAINATVAGGTTAALGASVIAMAEDMDKARRQGQKIDDFIKKIEK